MLDAACRAIRPTWTELMTMEFDLAIAVLSRLPGLDDETKALLHLFGAKK